MDCSENMSSVRSVLEHVPNAKFAHSEFELIALVRGALCPKKRYTLEEIGLQCSRLYPCEFFYVARFCDGNVNGHFCLVCPSKKSSCHQLEMSCWQILWRTASFYAVFPSPGCLVSQVCCPIFL